MAVILFWHATTSLGGGGPQLQTTLFAPHTVHRSDPQPSCRGGRKNSPPFGNPPLLSEGQCDFEAQRLISVARSSCICYPFRELLILFLGQTTSNSSGLIPKNGTAFSSRSRFLILWPHFNPCVSQTGAFLIFKTPSNRCSFLSR